MLQIYRKLCFCFKYTENYMHLTVTVNGIPSHINENVIFFDSSLLVLVIFINDNNLGTHCNFRRETCIQTYMEACFHH